MKIKEEEYNEEEQI